MAFHNKKYVGLCDILQIAFGAVLLVCLTKSQDGAAKKVVICYYDATAYWRQGAGRFQAGDIDPSICSHIIYSFVGMKESTSRIYSRDPGLDLAPGEEEPDPDDEVNYQGDLDMLRKTVRLRDEGNSDLKILMAVGGPQQSQQSFSIMAADAERRRQFVESAVEYITRFNLDGLDLYWLYPAVEADKQNFVQIMKELKEALDALSSTTGKDYTLTAALGCTKEIIDTGYSLVELARYVDYFNLLCFDFKMFSNESESTMKIGHHSSLHFKESESPSDQQLTVAFGVKYFLQLNAPPEKLVLGVAAHANTYKLTSSTRNNFYDVAAGPGPAGEFTGREGFLAYFEICAMIKQSPNNWLFRYDYDYRIPYLSKELIFIGYENEVSVQEKVDFAVDENLGGLMVKSIDLDDSRNICGAWYSFPITSSIFDRLQFWETNSKV